MVAIMGRWFPYESRGLVLGFWSGNSAIGNIVGNCFVAGLLNEAVRVQSDIFIFIFIYSGVIYICYAETRKDVHDSQPLPPPLHPSDILSSR